MPDQTRAGLNRFAPLVFAAAAIVVALLIGVGLLLRPHNVGPSPVPGPTRSSAPESTAQPTAASWTVTGTMTTARTLHTSTLLLDGHVLVAGGWGPGSSSPALGSAELYDPGTGTWTATGSMTTARIQHTATLLPDGKVLVAGGIGGKGELTSDQLLASVELYDPVTGTWTATGTMVSHSGDGFTVTLLLDGKVLVVGGLDTDRNVVPVASAELYDPGTGTWTATGTMATPRAGHTATLLPDGKVLVAGGGNFPDMLASAELYDPRTGTWTTTGSMTEGRSGDTATLLPDGKVLVAGGYVASLEAEATAELYDPASGTWTRTGDMIENRGGHTATLLRDGRVLVTGGVDVGGQAGLAELYDPGSGSWTATGNVDNAYGYTSATLLPDGRVLVVGSTSPELYDAGR